MIKLKLTKKIVLIIILILTSSCNFEMSEAEESALNESLMSSQYRKPRDGDYDKDNLSNCPLLIKLGQWEPYKNRPNEWGRDYSWINRSFNWQTDTGISVHNDTSSTEIYDKRISKGSGRFSYIGPWQYNKEISREIRFFAYQGRDGGDLSYQFETKTPENSKLGEKSFSLASKYPPDFNDLCIVKWIAKYGYNAVFDVKTGTIKQVE